MSGEDDDLPDFEDFEGGETFESYRFTSLQFNQAQIAAKRANRKADSLLFKANELGTQDLSADQEATLEEITDLLDKVLRVMNDAEGQK